MDVSAGFFLEGGRQYYFPVTPPTIALPNHERQSDTHLATEWDDFRIADRDSPEALVDPASLTPESVRQDLREAGEAFPICRCAGQAMIESDVDHRILLNGIRSSPQVPDG